MYFRNFMNELDPFQEMRGLRREMNRLFDEFGLSSQRTFPAINMWGNQDSIIIMAELPGLESNDVKLSIIEQKLLIEGNKDDKNNKSGTNYHRQERRFGNFKRLVQLPFNVDANKISASFNHGVLKVTLPRAEANKPKHIEIKTN